MHTVNSRYRHSIRFISSLLLLGMLSMSLFPLHFHLHHTAVTGGELMHDHTIDLHSNVTDHGYEHHADSHTIDPLTGYSMKLGDDSHPAVMFLITLILAPVATGLVSTRLHRLGPGPDQPRWQISSPLRAPPPRR